MNEMVIYRLQRILPPKMLFSFIKKLKCKNYRSDVTILYRPSSYS